MKLLNLGCGNRYHHDWINIDYFSNDSCVISHNLMNGIPFPENSVDVVYHSHVLEHFSRKDGEKFISECFRVLKNNGIIRIAVPDLEQIAREYLKNLELAINGDKNAEFNYEWIMLEMYDQVVRNTSGGEMIDYLSKKTIVNENYVYNRIGEEGRQIRRDITLREEKIAHQNISSVHSKKNVAFSFCRRMKNYIEKKVFVNEINKYNLLDKEASIGQFRMSGEIHQWMYDKYSLSKLLSNCGFANIEIQNPFKSKIQNWLSFNLEAHNNVIYKPDSLFIEAIKQSHN
jgi:predicted SAM-dependent methyltransferase